MNQPIRRVAVLGAGVMGSGIAAHMANVGIPVLLLDIVPRELTQEEEKKGLTLESPAVRNRFANNGVQTALKARPAAFYHKDFANLITTGNFDDDLEKIKDCDWVIEVVIENLEIKKKLFANVAKHLNEHAILSSNTSGLSIAKMGEDLPQSIRKRMLVTHFFNPVRYMKLLELIAGPETDPDVFKQIAEFGRERLGKGIVYGLDTPNFVANRIGVHGILVAIDEMLKGDYLVEEVDAVLGPAMGRPKSAAFRTVDLVGLDTLVHIFKNCYETLPDDEERELFKTPEFMQKMVDKGWLGAKSKKGFYEKRGKTLYAIDPTTLEYNEKESIREDSLGAARKTDDVRKRIHNLVRAQDRAGEFAWKVASRSLCYSARRVGEIATDIVNIDNGMKWGFAWDLGPFETWDAIGVAEAAARLESEGREVPTLIKAVLEKGEGTFYKYVNGVQHYFDAETSTYKPVASDPREYNLEILKGQEKVIKSNVSASLLDIGDGVALLEFHSKMNAIDDQIVEMMHYAIDEVEKNWNGLVIANQAPNFSVGANLFLIMAQALQKNWDALAMVVKNFQQANQRLRYSLKPTVAAPHGMALGGGAEVCLGADYIRATPELYIGLVEVGAGLIPGGGGTLQMLLRNMIGIGPDVNVDRFPFVRKTFETVGMAKVATSADEARAMSFLRPQDSLSINRDNQINDAKQLVLYLTNTGYMPPRYRTDILLPGPSGMGAINAALYSMKVGNYISDFDEHVGKKLGFVLTGGNCSPTIPVDEQYVLDLELEAFLSLCGEEKTHARMQALLQTGKPLRN